MKKAQTENKLYITAEQSGYTIITNNITRNTFLSDGAKSLYIYIKSQAFNENFYLSAQSIATYFNKGIATINREIKELKEHGFLILEQRKDSKAYYYKLVDTPSKTKITDYTTENIVNCFFDNTITINEIRALTERKIITKKQYDDIAKEIYRIIKKPIDYKKGND